MISTFTMSITTQSLSLLRTWVVDTGLLPDLEGGEGWRVVDSWGILTPSRNRAREEMVEQEEEEEIKCFSPSKKGRRTVEVLETPVKESFTLDVGEKRQSFHTKGELQMTPITSVTNVI